jgi:hypothetical protein
LAKLSLSKEVKESENNGKSVVFIGKLDSKSENTVVKDLM